MPARHRMYLWAGAMIATNLVLLTLLPPRRTVTLGCFLGSLAAQATLAAAWAAFGAAPLAQRWIVSIGWIFAVWLAAGVSVAVHSGPGDAMAVLGVFLLVQFLLLQIPLWSLVLGLGLQLRHRDDVSTNVDGGTSAISVRFGVRHLFVIMSAVGLFLGLGRVVVPMIRLSGSEDAPIFIFLGVAGVVMTFPLLIATLMRRMVVLGVVLSLLFVGVATMVELPLFQQLGGRGPDGDDFIAINTASAIVVLAITAVVRAHGFFLQPVAAANLGDGDLPGPWENG